MKQKRSNTRKIIKSIWMIIVILIMITIGLFMLSKKVNKIKIFDNIKEQAKFLTNQIQNTIETNKLELNTKVNLSAANGKGGVDLDWSAYDATDKVFKAYQKKEDQEGAEWESISTFDFYSKGIEPIKVLNIYPESSSLETIPTVTFNYSDGTSRNIPKSAALKVWMEGGTMNGTSFKAYGINPITGEQIIKVTPISNAEFNNNPNVIWNYDVIMYGTWDINAGNFLNNNAIKVVEEYIKAGYGILAGHDTIGWDYNYYNAGLSKLRKYFNIEIGYWNYTNTNVHLIDLRMMWSIWSSYVRVNKTGLLTNFPYELPLGAKLTIPTTHTTSNAAKGNVWMTLIDETSSDIYRYYNAGGKENPVYYLTTYNNTAMIQTGHSNCKSTDDERKILANTLFYLKQLTKSTSFIDNSSQDLKAPNAPKIIAERINNSTENIKVSFNAKDNGSTYSFYVEAYDSKNGNTKIATSNQRTELVTTGTKGYYYIIDSDINNKDFDIKASNVKYTEDESVILDILNNGKYIHVKAIDVAGNVGTSSVVKIDVEEYTITVDNDREGHTYNSYQVFKGDYYEKEEKIIDENGKEKIVKTPVLSNIEWGAELQKEIVSENEEDKGKTHGDKIIEELKKKNSKVYKDCETAEDIAKVLEGEEYDGEIIREFTDLVGKYILDNKILITKGTSEIVQEKDLNGNVIDENYKITHLESGYYIVIDAETAEKDDSYSRYLIDVVQNVTMYPKSSIPTIRKSVAGNNIKTKSSEIYKEDEKRNTATYKEKSKIYNAEDYDIEFELKTYIPNLDKYSTYKFEIVDILDKGFELDKNSIKIMLGKEEYPKTREKVIKGNEDIRRRR